MSTQIGHIASWAAVTMLGRPDLLPQAIDAALSVYQVTCEKIPFEVLQTTSAELPCTVDVAEYSLANLDPPVAGIVSLRMSYSATSKRRLRRSHVRLYDALNNVQSGQPATYARWGLGIEFDKPTNSASYTYRIRYWSTPTIPKWSSAQDEKANYVMLTPPSWDELFMWEVLYRLYYANGEVDKAISLVAPRQQPAGMRGMIRKLRIEELGIIPRLWNDLLRTISQREQVDENFSVNPVVREYTW